MDEMFRMILVRNAEAIDDSDVVEVKGDTALQREIRSMGKSIPKPEIDALLAQQVQPQKLEQLLRPNGPANMFRHLKSELTKLENPSAPEVNEAIINNLGDTFEERIHGADWAEQKAELEDALLIYKLQPDRDRQVLNDIVSALQAQAFVEQWVDRSLKPISKDTLHNLLNRPIRMSLLRQIAPFTAPAPAPLPAETHRPSKEQLESESRKIHNLNNALHELSSLPPRLFTTQTAPPKEDKPDNETRGRLFGLFNFGRATKSMDLAPVNAEKLRVSTEGIEEIGLQTRQLVSDQGLDFHRDSLSVIMSGLDSAKAGMVKNIKPEGPSFATNIADLLGTGRWGIGDRFFWQLPWFPLDPKMPAVPKSHGSVQPIGVGELLIVRQQVIRYEPGEIAHIENVLQGEEKNRTHRRRDLTENIFVEETEIEREEERNLETAERFELSRESNEVIKEELKIEGGLKVTITPSTAVSIEASANVSYTNARESARRRASEYAKEIVNKSVNRISERIRKQETLRTVREIEEVSEHGLDNIKGTGNIVGIYQWVNKVYQAQIYRYGTRQMYDFVIPEPGAFLIQALEQEAVSQSGKPKPEPFSLDADELTEEDYLFYANKYHATDIDPPPKAEITLTAIFTSSGGGDDAVSSLAQKQTLNIPEGYEALQAHIVAGFAGSQLCVAVGQHMTLYQDSSGYRSFNLQLEKGAIPVSMVANGASVFSINIEVLCRRTERAMLTWRIQTHAEIKQAYLKALADFEEAVAQAVVNRGVNIKGRNPQYNQELTFTELKKHCISVLTNQHFDLFNGVEVDSSGIPQANLSVAQQQGDYIRFFEQAFEWHLMSFVLYPYFWGRKSHWIDRVKYEDNDPEFMAFIKAGAARVLLPVRENFRAAVSHFMGTGEIWEGGPLPDITDPDYVPIVQELRERTGAPGDEIPEGKPWLVRVPTRLIKLREDGSLPHWTQDESGDWRLV